MGRAKIVLTCAAIALGNGAQAGGLDRTGQSLGPLFEKGRYLSVDVSSSQPRIQGTDILGHSTGQVAASYTQWGFAYKQDLNPQTSMRLSYQAQQFKLTPWVSYQRLGDANISSGNTPMASMASGSATAFGIKLGYSF